MKTTRSWPSAPGLSLSRRSPAWAPGSRHAAGILTGEAAVTIGATNQGMVAGDLVNTAAGCRQWPRPGTVLVGESTQRAAAAAIAFEPAGEQTLKGKQSPVSAWRAVRVVGERGGRNRTETLEAPFVGRQEELQLLKDLFHATGREKRLRVVSLVGPAGIGKSRLVVGVLQVPRRRRGDRLLAPRPIAGVRRGDHLLGPRRDGPRTCRAGRKGRRDDHADQGPRRWSRSGSPTRTSGRGSSAPC